MSHPDKVAIISLINRLLERSGLTIDQVVARMQAHGCDLTRSTFENNFTTRAGRGPNLPPEWILAAVAAFTERLTDRERCTAAEAVELARLARLPIDRFESLQAYFPPAEFLVAYHRYLPSLDQTTIKKVAPDSVQPAAGPKTPDIPCPYQGLRAFDEAQANFFFGRDAEIERMVDSLRHSRFLAVIGPSGVGKSSLVRAGLTPALRRGAFQPEPDPLPAAGRPWRATSEAGSDRWLLQVFEPGPRPLESLAVALLETGLCGPNRPLRTLIDELAADERGLHLLISELLARQPPPGYPYLALVVDQFEELFTLCEAEPSRRAFIANLHYAATLLDGQTVLILAMRADFYSRAAMYPDLARLLADHQLLVSPMAGPALADAITRPAEQVGLQFEPGLVERLLQDAAAEPGSLPLLQHALLELWTRRDGTQLTLAAYQASGGVGGALTQRADRLLAALNPARQAILRRIMLRLTRLGESAANTRRRATLAELVRTPDEAEDVRTVVNELAGARLVTIALNRETGQELVEVAHEALIRGWPTLQHWLAQDRDALRLHQQLAEAAGEWQRHGRDESFLYRGLRLATAEAWAAAYAGEMNTLERGFLAASLSVRDGALKAQEKRRRRLIWGLSGGLVLTLAGLLLLLGLGWLAYTQQQQLAAERQATLSRQLAAHSGDLMSDQLDLALLLGVEAFHVADTSEARSSLLALLAASRHLTAYLRGHTGWVNSVAFSPDGQMLASAGADGAIVLWDSPTRQPLDPPLTGHSGWVNSVAFSPDPDRTILASGGADGTVRLWDLSSGRPLGAPLSGHTGFVTAVAFGPEGQTLASAGADGVVILWDISTGPLSSVSSAQAPEQPLAYGLTGHQGFVLELAFSPDGRLLASGSEDNTLILWDVAARQPLAPPLTGHKGAVSGLAFSPDGQILASGSAGGSMLLWAIDTGVSTVSRLGEPLAGHDGAVTGLAFSPDGQILASGSADQTVRLWDVTRTAAGIPFGQPLGPPLTGHAERVTDVAFSPDDAASGSQMLASSSADGDVILWDVRAELPLGRYLTGHTEPVSRVAFSQHPVEIGGAAQQVLASGSRDQTIILWDVETGQPLGRPLTGHTHFVWGLAFSPTNDETGRQILASGDEDGQVRLWSVGQSVLAGKSAGQPLGSPYFLNLKKMADVRFSPDGQSLAIGGEKLITLLDLSTRQQFDRSLAIQGRIESLAFSPDGRTLAVGEQGSITFWEVNAGRPPGPVQGKLPGHPGIVLGLAYSHDGQLLASGSTDQTIRLWDVSTRQPVGQPLTGHTGAVSGLDFSPDGQTLISGGRDGLMILWDVATQQMLGRPLPVNDHIFRLALSPDGRTLAISGNEDGAVILWPATPDAWQRQACRLAGRNLTPAEWPRFLGDRPYRPTCPEAPWPVLPQSKSTPRPAITPATSGGPAPAARGVLVETFDSSQGFIQTAPNIYVAEGQVKWHFQRSGGAQYLYRPIPAFSGDVRLTVRGQVDSWTNNCQIRAGIGEKPRTGLAIGLGYFGGGCDTNGAVAWPVMGATFDMQESACKFSGDWLWLTEQTPYTIELTLRDGEALLAVEGVGQAAGEAAYDGIYTTLWVGNSGDGDWPDCAGSIEEMVVEPLDRW